MKLRPAYLVIFSIIVFSLDFLILANKTIFPSNTIDGFLVVVIAFVCLLIFISGIIWAIVKLIPGKAKSVVPVPAQDQRALTKTEIVFNRLFAVLLILLSIPLPVLNMTTIPTIVIFVIFVIFLWFGKKYHLIANIVFLIFALGIYFVPIPPLAWGVFRGLKEFRLNGFAFNIPILFSIPLLIFISFAVRNMLGNIFAYSKAKVSHNAFYFVSLLSVFVTVTVYPLIDSVKLRERTMNVNYATGGELGLVYTKQTLTFLDRYTMAGDFTSKFDPQSQKYIYHLRLTEPLAKDIRFTKVETDGRKIDFSTDNLAKCLNCQKDENSPFGIVFPSGKNIDFVVTGDQLIKVIIFTEPENKTSEFVFWR